MQRLKSERKKRILLAAKEAFLRDGFEKTTISSIARSAHVATGNIYDYFANKEEIFETLIKPVTRKIETSFRLLEVRVVLKKEKFKDFSWSRQIIEAIINFISANQDDLYLLFAKSSNEDLEQYRKKYYDRYHRLFSRYMKLISSKYPELRTLSELLAKHFNTFCLNIFVDVIVQRMSLEEMRKYAEEATTFVWYGLQAVTRRSRTKISNSSGKAAEAVPKNKV